MRIELPWPDSSLAPNRKNGRHWGAVHSAKVKRLADARYLTLYAMRSTGYVPPAGALALSLTFCPPDRRRRDLDNLLKGALDALVHAQVIRDDSLIDRLTLERCNVVTDGKLLVTVEPL